MPTWIFAAHSSIWHSNVPPLLSSFHPKCKLSFAHWLEIHFPENQSKDQPHSLLTLGLRKSLLCTNVLPSQTTVTPNKTCPATLEIIWLFMSVHQLEQLQCKSWAYSLYWVLTDWSSMRTYLVEYCSLQYPTCITIQPLGTYIICYKQYCILSL